MIWLAFHPKNYCLFFSGINTTNQRQTSSVILASSTPIRDFCCFWWGLSSLLGLRGHDQAGRKTQKKLVDVWRSHRRGSVLAVALHATSVEIQPEYRQDQADYGEQILGLVSVLLVVSLVL